MPDGEREHRVAAALLPIVDWGDLVQQEGNYAAYGDEGDECLLDAARALDLPGWATIDRVPSGGPGSGYDAVWIFLREEHTIEDLAEWMKHRGAGTA